jgi:hypothetical protein
MLVRLICWKEAAAQEHTARLQGAGLRVDGSPLRVSGIIGHIRESAPDVVLIDLDVAPSRGRAVASILRQSKSVAGIPLAFAGGAVEKVETVRQDFPDAVFCSWEKAAAAVKKARAPLNPVRPAPYMQRYAGAPLLRKLDIKPNLTVALIAAPDGFEELLGELPDGVTLQTRVTKDTGLAVYFVRSRRELDAIADYLAGRLAGGGSAWIVYPKQTGRFKVDFNLTHIRATMLEADLVDYKVCSVDADWTGLKFTRAKR